MAHSNGNVVVPDPITSHQAPRGAKLTENTVAIVPGVYAALYAPGTSQPHSFETKDWDAFVAKNVENVSSQGGKLCLTSISAHVDDSSTTWFTGVWNIGTGSSTVGRYNNWQSFEAHFKRFESHQRLLDFDIYASGGQRFYIATWGSTSITQRFVHDVSLDEFMTSLKDLSDQNWRLTRIRLYPDGARRTWHATGLFEQNMENDVPLGRYDLVFKNDWVSFFEQYQSYQVPQMGMRMRLEDFEVFDDYQKGKRYYVGIYHERPGENEVVFNEGWGTTISVSNQIWKVNFQLKKIVRYAHQIHMPTPDWKNSFKTRLAEKCVGYCGWQFHGNMEAFYPFGLARAKQDWPTPSIDQTKPPQAFTINTRFNLASVSKPVTGLAVMRLVYQKKITSLDDKFYDYVSKEFPNVPEGVKKVTIRNLLQMKSGMEVENHIAFENIWTFLTKYFNDQKVNEQDIGTVLKYSNTNFTILQAVINCVTGRVGKGGKLLDDYYATYVSEEILGNMGVDRNIFNPVPDSVGSQALYYADPTNTQKGISFTQMTGVAAAGWISSVKELATFVLGAYNGTALDKDHTEIMFGNELGWDKWEGLYGQYFYHAGAFGGSGSEGVQYGLTTCIMIFPNRTAALLLINHCADNWTNAPTELIRAYEAQVGIPTPQ